MEATFHSSRHAWATKAVSAGWDWESIRNQLDHHSAAFTAGRYAHPVGRHLDPDVGMLTPLTNRSRRSQSDTLEDMDDDASDGNDSENGARDRARTGDPQLGKLMLYQLSYSRAAAETRARAVSLPIVTVHAIR